MNAGKTVVFGLAACFVLASTVGCLFPAGPERTSNQGGGNILTATEKIVGGQMSQLTPDEVQIIADEINQLSPEVDLTLADDQAEVIVDFLTLNNINSFQDFQTLDPDTVQIPEGAAELFQNLDLLGGEAG